MAPAESIDIRRVAELARLDLDDAQAAQLQQELGRVVQYIDELKSIDIEGIEPTAHAMPRFNVWREDNAKDSFPRETMLANAPACVADDLLKVPKVLPGEEGN
jgi:aspartyl-tRNA(Asn)/glutamyl-tRNA(Gln) amidotransferase subunit C